MRRILLTIIYNYQSMNAKEAELRRIVDVVIGCCATEIQEGSKTITRDEVLGRSRSENAVMTRCILVDQIITAGYSIATAALVLNRTAQAVRHMLEMCTRYRRTSRAYRIADEEARTKCRHNDALP